MLSQYASHMTGHLSQVAGALAGRDFRLVALSLAVLALFVSGAALASAMIARGNFPRARGTYCAPLALQGLLLGCLGFADAVPQAWQGWAGLGLLAFAMGLQNATITRISGARIRTTHATGLLTDMGIEIGRGLFGRGADGYDRARLVLFVQLVACFVLGGIAGVHGQQDMGWRFALVPAAVLLALAAATAPRVFTVSIPS
ncbi:YoaK family protein [Mangrovicoccus ximenensis]|uniref:YoaK family protein n=1 Tax=Mangrovicoccus ximenensis TaxID=1911570 RepID=UPI001F293809|nr:YoaK family protein [Mangrovicoccus ximenensis]